MTTVFTRCGRFGCRGRVGSYLKAQCVDEESSDFGELLKIEIPDGYIVMLPNDEDDKIRHEIACLQEAVDGLRRTVYEKDM